MCEELGYEGHIVDYNYGGIEEKVAPVAKFFAAPNKKRAFSTLLRGLLGYWSDKKREKAFMAFRNKYLNESVRCNSAADIDALGYDALIAGSDQIWNQGITKHRYDPVFFMDFETNARKILYGASSEDVPFGEEKEAAFVKALDGLSGEVSIREKKLADYVRSLTGREYAVVLDPTLMAGREVIEAIPTPEPPTEPYILLYQIDSNPNTDISVKSLEARFGCRAYTMTVPRIGDKYGRCGEASPEEFLALLKGALFLVTNSFHGIAFSILFEKKFFVYNNNGVMSRIDGLLSQSGLMDRKVKMVADIDVDREIDYSSVSASLQPLRRFSRSFLEQALG